MVIGQIIYWPIVRGGNILLDLTDDERSSCVFVLGGQQCRSDTIY